MPSRCLRCLIVSWSGNRDLSAARNFLHPHLSPKTCPRTCSVSLAWRLAPRSSGGPRTGPDDAIVADADGAAAQPRTALPILPSATYQPVNIAAYRIGIRDVDGDPET